ncbi:acid phosphatase [Silvibacterium acidisoli]|uniref:acid phosphatase n=1 Tax=Acidobacteriaceae bacterium ZG23-2 TaxID=2883246 RepID=UPI00406D3936
MIKTTSIAAIAGLQLFLCGIMLAQSVTPSTKKIPIFFSPDTLNFNEILSAPPDPNSDAGRRDRDELLRIERTRTQSEIQAAQQDDQEEDIFIFRDVVGPSFTPEKFPLMKAFSAHLKNDSEVVDPPLKHLFNRPRPYQADLTQHPVCQLSKEPSYPSGHSMLGYLFGYVLAQMIPEKRDAILKRADLYAYHRLVCGVHYPQDLEASRIASSVLFGLISTNPAYRKEFDSAQQELRQQLQ